MKNFNIYFMSEKVRHRAGHERFYSALNGQCTWIERVEAGTVREAFQLARDSLARKIASCGTRLSPLARSSKIMYAEDGTNQKCSFEDPRTIL